MQIESRLYYSRKNHKNIALKKINFFLEYIRTTFYLKTNILDDKFYTGLAKKSGVSFIDIKNVFNQIHFIRNKIQIDENELFRMNNKINKFYRKTKIIN